MARIFSGIQPSGELHIGNWLGAVQNWVNLQQSYDCIFCVVDLHAITGKYEHETLAQRTRDMAIGLLACGIDPARAMLFVQSHVPEHSELQWLLNSVTPLGELERMTQYKDKAQRFESVPAGILNYPVLMAADILLYRADLVPVGEDQTQHLELARELARKWNAEFGGGRDYFPEPQAILTEAKRIMGLDGQAKMSKSLGNTIGLLDTPEEIWQKLRPAVAGSDVVLTNTKAPTLTRVWIHDASNYAIRGHTVTDFALDRSVINGVNGTNGTTPIDETDKVTLRYGNGVAPVAVLGGGLRRSSRVSRELRSRELTGWRRRLRDFAASRR
jgi:tryptophanyl-tRNA synthetase